MPKLLLAPVLTSLAVLLLCTNAHAQTVQRVMLKGTVSDVQGAVVPNALVAIANKDGTHRATTSEFGEYQLSLQPGIYKVFAEAPKLGFVTTYRSDIKLDGSTRVLNFTIYGKVTGFIEYTGKSSDVRDHPPMQLFNSNYEKIPDLSKTGVRSGMVRFGTKSETKDLTIYKGRAPGASNAGITFTYDFFTVEADELRYEPRTKDIFAIGDVVIEIGDKTERYTGLVKIRIADGKVTHQRMDR